MEVPPLPSEIEAPEMLTVPDGGVPATGVKATPLTMVPVGAEYRENLLAVMTAIGALKPAVPVS